MPRTPAWTLIDTRLWVLALRAPVYLPGSHLGELGGRAADIVRSALREDVVLFSPQLVAEVHHVATSRVRPRLVGVAIGKYLQQVLGRRNARFRTLSRPLLEEALSRTAESGIHVWDYLVVLPWKGRVDRILTMDPHYRHAHFTALAAVENPLGIWASEGQPLG
jgi:hypothetical protein